MNHLYVADTDSHYLVVACIVTILVNYFADKAGQRGVFLLAFQSVAIIGFLMLVTNGIPHVQYAGVFLAASGMREPGSHHNSANLRPRHLLRRPTHHSMDQ